ncbi:MAG: DegT/DnrJ/EryC1/StrS family aminotransferase [Opitutaceae bacterium]|jgi:dTDP-4-amino-4,6-dideoxygalactose transaminase
MNKDQMVSFTVAERIASRPFLPFALPDTGEEEIREVATAIKSGWITAEPRTTQFEKEFADAVGAKHAIAVNSGTAALHIALEAAGVKKGDEVITTPYTFAATSAVIRYFDATPVFVDVDPLTLNIDPAGIEAAITQKTKAILPVHIAGLPADMNAIHGVAERFHLPLIEDAAHAFPAKYNGTTIGSLSDMTCFSFSATETITTGEGGMLCTENDEYADRCRMMAQYGISKDAWKRYTAEGSWYYEIVSPGFKYYMSDIAAGMGLAQLRKADSMLEKRRAIARAYNTGFSQFPHFQLPYDNPSHRHAWHLYMLRLNLDMLAIDRALFVEELRKRHIGVSVHFIPLHTHPYYRQLYGCKPEDFPVAYREYMREISLPIYSKMTENDVEDVIDAVVDVLMQFGR